MPNPSLFRPKGFRRFLVFLPAMGAGLLFWMDTAGLSAEPVSPVPASKRWVIDYTGGVLWSVGGGATPLSYTLAPQIISVLCPPVFDLPFAGGRLIHRARLSLLLEPIIAGPETRYIGTAAAGDLEWLGPSGKFACFFAGGGGFGLMDSRGYDVEGAQGQDFNLNWLLHTGVRLTIRRDWRWSAGLYFQHISNRGMDKVNPGLNALGPTLGLSRGF